jgi:hypothetical protein
MIVMKKYKWTTHTKERRKEWEGMKTMKMIVMVRIPKNPKRGTHLYGSMSQSLVKGKGVEHGNLYATIVTQNTQVPIPV